MRADEAVKKQLGLRLKRLRRRVAELNAEITMVEQLMADVENRSANSHPRLRKNSVTRLNMQSAIKRILKLSNEPVRAQDILTKLREFDSTLKSSTFRSHLRRMTEAGAIKNSEGRGYYQLNVIDDVDKELTFRRVPEHSPPFSFE